MKTKNIAIIGSGATAIYLLKHIGDNIKVLKDQFNLITIFERSGHMGMGMPYSPETTDIFNLANISSVEIPELPQTFGDWLREQSREELVSLNVTDFPIDDSEVYGRLALGRYLHEQYRNILLKLKEGGIRIREVRGVHVSDIVYNGATMSVTVATDRGEHADFLKVVIATGHLWNEADRPENGYFGSPWPIKKLLPAKGGTHNFKVGTLGASLSAFDVATSLAHRHGSFSKNEERLSFKLREGAEGFKLAMHSSEGWLPHLQYEQMEPMREIYRHTDKGALLSLVDEKGFLGIETFFDRVCRPALSIAFERDGMGTMVTELNSPNFTFKKFVEMMSKDHEYSDSFEGMKKEMFKATDSVENNRPIHWMETLDDLMYCLNFHAELLPAEDHVFFKSEVSPFLMNVIAALPLQSADILIALHEAGCIELITGKVTVLECNGTDERTFIEVESVDGETTVLGYDMFINCAGQKSIGLDDFPFPSLVRDGHLRRARAKIKMPKELQSPGNGSESRDIIEQDGQAYLDIGGIDIDAAYRIIGTNGIPNERIMDITFTHTSGIRPYSYGLQACSATSKILVASWMARTEGQFQADVLQKV